MTFDSLIVTVTVYTVECGTSAYVLMT